MSSDSKQLSKICKNSQKSTLRKEVTIYTLKTDFLILTNFIRISHGPAVSHLSIVSQKIREIEFYLTQKFMKMNPIFCFRNSFTHMLSKNSVKSIPKLLDQSILRFHEFFFKRKSLLVWISLRNVNKLYYTRGERLIWLVIPIEIFCEIKISIKLIFSVISIVSVKSKFSMKLIFSV